MEREYRATRSTLPEDHDPFEERIERDPLRLFDHWALFDNIFPYDAIADAHHILVARRKFADPLEVSPGLAGCTSTWWSGKEGRGGLSPRKTVLP